MFFCDTQLYKKYIYIKSYFIPFMQTKITALPADSVMFVGSHVHNWTGLTVGNRRTEKIGSIISHKSLKKVSN